MILDIKSKSKSIKPLSTDEFNPASFTNDLIEVISKDNNLNKNRIRITLENEKGKTVLAINKTFKQLGISDDCQLIVKDLGPQIDWKTVFVIEYLGPIIFHSIFFYGYHSFFNEYQNTKAQIVLYDLSLLHFLKREYETLFVHKFSNATMPVKNIFKNSFHYWILNGVLCSAFVYVPETLKYSKNPLVRWAFASYDWSPSFIILWALFIIFCEFSNYLTHVNLSSLRDQNPKNYEIPFGYGFNWVSCPNYFFEIMSFVGFSILSGNWAYILFTLVASVQMYIWAVGKHKRYLKTFGNDYKKLNRKVLVPFVL